MRTYASESCIHMEGELVSVPDGVDELEDVDLRNLILHDTPERETKIDFNESQRAWRYNKVKKENCTFVYRCMVEMANGKICKRGNCKSAQHIRKRDVRDN